MIEQGSKVTIHYTLTVDDEQVESSFGKEPLTYQQGQGQLIPGLEEELDGHGPGDTLEVSVPPEKAYGERDPERMHLVARQAFTDPNGIKVGGFVEGKTRTGEAFRAQIVEERDDGFILDLNHPLAGKTLDFKVEVVDVAPGTSPS